MADTDLNIFLNATDNATRVLRQAANAMSHLEAVARRVGPAQALAGQAVERASQQIAVQGQAALTTGQRIQTWGGKIQSAGQSLALGFTVPLVASAAVLHTFDESAARLQAGEAFERTAQQFKLNSDELVEALQRASGGTLTSLETMQAASRAMVLGVGGSVGEFAELMEIARDRARVFGVTTAQAFNDLTLGIGRQSRLILDNLGIIVRVEDATKEYARTLGKTEAQLTLEEKRQAFLNAVLEQTRATMDRSALATRNASEEYQHQRAQIQNLVEEFQMSALPVLNELLNVFNALPQSLKVSGIGFLAIMLVVGPLVSAFGAVVRLAGVAITAIGRLRDVAVAAATGQSILAAATGAAAAAETAQAGAATKAAVAKTNLARAAGAAAVAETGLGASTLATSTRLGALSIITRGLGSSLTVMVVAMLAAVAAGAVVGELLGRGIEIAVKRADELDNAIAALARRIAEAFAAIPGLIGQFVARVREAIPTVGELRRAIESIPGALADIPGAAASAFGAIDNWAAQANDAIAEVRQATFGRLPVVGGLFSGAGGVEDFTAAMERAKEKFRQVEAALQPDAILAAGTAAEMTAEDFKALAESFAQAFAGLSALQSLLGAITAIESTEELQLQRTIAQQDLVIANRKLELGVFGKQQSALEQSASAIELERDALGKQVQAVDVAIRERQLYIQTLVPPELEEEIRLLERNASAQERAANVIQRQINAIERQAGAMERANRPLERAITLLDLQARKLELASRPARRRLDELQKIPGLSQDVVRAAQKEVDVYDRQLAMFQDQQDALQLQLDTRRLEIELTQEGTETLQDQLDVINDGIGATRDMVGERRDWIATLTPPELEREIAVLQRHRDQLDLQRQKLELLIPTRNQIKASTGDTFDPIINSAQAAKERAEALLERLDAMKRIGRIDVTLGANLTPQFATLQVILEALSVLRSDQMTRFFEMVKQGKTAPFLAAYFSLPSAMLMPAVLFQHGGVVTKPTQALIGEAGPEAVIPLKRIPRQVAQTIIEVGRGQKPIERIARAISNVKRATQVKALQHGDIITRPTRALIGEAGPEAVVPLKRIPQRIARTIIEVGRGQKPIEMIAQVIERTKERTLARLQHGALIVKPGEDSPEAQQTRRLTRSAEPARRMVQRSAQRDLAVSERVMERSRVRMQAVMGSVERTARLAGIPALPAPRLPGFALQLPPPVLMQAGGIVPRGVVTPAILHGPEAVIPLNRMESGATINVPIQIENWWGNDDAAIDELARKVENRIRRRWR